MKHILEMTNEQLTEALAGLGQPTFRARQVAEWVWKKHVAAFEQMTNLPAALRERLAAEFQVLSARPAGRSEAPDGTVKLLLALADGQRIETVGIPDRARLTACVSTQVGCGMGCAFCATGLGGLKRNLTAGEIVEQVFHLQRGMGGHVTNVVFMGMGEPLANYAATVSAVRAMIDPQRLGLSARHVTVSTVGLPRQIRRLAREGLPVTLAISLHAPNDALRAKLIPVAGQVPLADILSAAEAFYDSRHREVTLEYVLLAGVNDTKVCAEGLARIARRLRCNVNLIRYNPVTSLAFQRPAEAQVETFAARLGELGVNVHVRRSRGLDVTAACGQLRQEVPQESAR
jgi:23S rRNA (adenine2503-C2)-methyltransferase